MIRSYWRALKPLGSICMSVRESSVTTVYTNNGKLQPSVTTVYTDNGKLQPPVTTVYTNNEKDLFKNYNKAN